MVTADFELDDREIGVPTPDRNKGLQLRNGWACRVVRVLPHTKVCEYSL